MFNISNTSTAENTASSNAFTKRKNLNLNTYKLYAKIYFYSGFIVECGETYNS